MAHPLLTLLISVLLVLGVAFLVLYPLTRIAADLRRRRRRRRHRDAA